SDVVFGLRPAEQLRRPLFRHEIAVLPHLKDQVGNDARKRAMVELSLAGESGEERDAVLFIDARLALDAELVFARGVFQFFALSIGKERLGLCGSLEWMLKHALQRIN